MSSMIDDAVFEPIQQVPQQLEPLDPSKRPPNAFILFSRTVRAMVQSQNPGMTNIEHTRIMAKMWKNMPEIQRNEFKEQAAKLQEEFKQRNPNYSYKKSEKKKKNMYRYPDNQQNQMFSIFPASTLEISWSKLMTDNQPNTTQHGLDLYQMPNQPDNQYMGMMPKL